MNKLPTYMIDFYLIIVKLYCRNGIKQFNEVNKDKVCCCLSHLTNITLVSDNLRDTSVPFYHLFVTVRNEVAKVMFLQACVYPQGGCTWSRGVPRGPG